MSSSPHNDDKKKDILILGKCSTQVLEHKLTDCRKLAFNQLY